MILDHDPKLLLAPDNVDYSEFIIGESKEGVLLNPDKLNDSVNLIKVAAAIESNQHEQIQQEIKDLDKEKFQMSGGNAVTRAAVLGKTKIIELIATKAPELFNTIDKKWLVTIIISYSTATHELHPDYVTTKC